MLQCNFCGKECKNNNSLRNHERLCKLNENRQQSSLVQFRKDNPTPWNAGLTKELDQRIATKAKNESSRRLGKPNPISDDARAKLRNLAKERNLGGYNPTGGRGKKGWYCGYWCDSSWELAWVIYQLDHGLVFVKNTVRFQYTYDNKLRNYIPDFFIPATNTYVEIKGYRSAQFDAKVAEFPHSLVVVYENDMLDILQYVVAKHGKEFTALYNQETS